MHYWESVPGWFDYQDLYSGLAQAASDDDTIVEVGVFLGRSSCYMMEELKRLGRRTRFYCVDLFKITPDDADTGGDGCMPWDENAREWKERMGYDALYDCAKFYLTHGPASDRLTEMIQGDSAATAARFGDGTVKVVFIDASHRYPNVKKDLEAWWPKVKVGGFLTGHDWVSGEEVRRAVTEFAQARGLKLGQVSGNCWIIPKEAA